MTEEPKGYGGGPGEGDAGADVADALARAVQEGRLDRVAAVLAGLDTLLALPSQEKALEYLEEGGEKPEVLGATTDDGAFIPFYFTDGRQAQRYLRERGGGVDSGAAGLLMGAAPARRIRNALEEGFGGMVVNPGSSHPAVLDREALEALAGMLEGAGPEAAAERAPAAEEAPARGGPRARSGAGSAAEVLLRRVSEAPDLEPVPPPELSGDAARERFQGLRRGWEEDRIPPWELLDGLGFELALHVPVCPEPVFGLRWPLLSPHPSDPERPSVRVFTHAEAARAALSELPDVETLRLSGIEAFRWIWAAPGGIDGIVLDLYPGSPGPLVIPETWPLGVLYPHFLDYSDLGSVRRVPPGRVGALPGARGLKAEVVRALVTQASELVAVEGEGEDGPPRVEHGGRRYVPAFTGPDRYFDFDGAHPERSGSPRSGGDTAPFREWLLASADCDGVLLDPGSESPLPLDHTDLTLLALWAGTGSRPDGTDVAVGIESAREELGEEIAGRVVADWPRYYWARQPPGDGGPTQSLTLPRRDACPVFTAEEKVRRFLERVREWEMVDEAMQPSMYLTGWAFNVFREMAESYDDGGWINPRALRVLESLSGSGGMLDGAFDAIDPDATDGDGLEVSPEMAEGALERIDERLMPRVPGFVA